MAEDRPITGAGLVQIDLCEIMLNLYWRLSCNTIIDYSVVLLKTNCKLYLYVFNNDQAKYV